MAFDSQAGNLETINDQIVEWEIFLHDRDVDDDGFDNNDDDEATNDISTIQLTPGSNGNSQFPVMPRKDVGDASLESRFFVFQSDSTTFDMCNWAHPPFEYAWDPGPFQDIFLYDSSGLAIVEPVVGQDNFPPECEVPGPRIYADSRVFDEGATSNGASGSWTEDAQNTLVNLLNLVPTLGNPWHPGAVVYLDGSNIPHVVFESLATNLTAGNTASGTQHIYVREIAEVGGGLASTEPVLLSHRRRP
ncbi:MAG: hypothetical protein MUO76_19650 [Anaerolineaceae bacterium]|nr:hypothetical protein [Anaerolineaceae bacterium]